MVVKIQGCGSGWNTLQKGILMLDVGDFCIEVHEHHRLPGKRYRFSISDDGSLKIALINGVDARIQNVDSYPGIVLFQKRRRVNNVELGNLCRQ